jgi:biotin carboxyl carrier protein
MPARVTSEISGNVWRIEVVDGQAVSAGDVIVILESMKMEIPVEAPGDGICRLAVSEGQPVQDGALIATIERP